MDTKVTVSISKDITKDYKRVVVPFSKIKDLVKSEYNYSAGTFKDGYRNKDNYAQYADMIILDIDDGLSIDGAKALFQPMTHIIATTKSHQKDKNGVKCDRFRVILPVEQDEGAIDLSTADYELLMKEILTRYPFCDQVCKDASRFYFPSKESIVYEYQGICGFYWRDYLQEARARQISEQAQKDRISKFEAKMKPKIAESKEYEYDYQELTQLEWYKKYQMTDKLLDALKFNEKFVSGKRNHTLWSYGKHLQDVGLDNDEVRENLLWINAQGDSISETEMQKTIFRSLRI